MILRLPQKADKTAYTVYKAQKLLWSVPFD